MGVNLKHIAEGWGKSLGLLEVSQQDWAMSERRMDICAECKHATESKFLKIIGRDVKEMGAIVCGKCPSLIKCPVNEKTLVKSEKCPVGLW